MSAEAFVIGSGVVCAIGHGAAQSAASFRAGLSAYTLSSVLDRRAQPVRLALVPELELMPLASALERERLCDRERRMLRLGGMALAQLDAFEGPLFLALPEPRSALGGISVSEQFVAQLGRQSGRHFGAGSETFALGRAGGFYALRAGLAALARGAPQVLVGGVESFLDMRLLSVLDGERRLLNDDVSDGFTPGEAAAFLWLARRPPRGRVCVLRGVGTADDPGHRYSDQPALGVGVAAALDDLQRGRGALPAVRTCFAGLNGENFGAKAWGVAHMRQHRLFDPELAFEHPADLYGDVGAATATLLLAIAGELLHRGHELGPVLTWAASDHAPCGAAYLDVTD